MTQALAMASFLREAGHEVARVWVGRSPWRSTPSYFLDGIGAPVEAFDAPVQVPDRRGLGASPAATALDAVRRTPAFARAARAIDRRSRGLDVVVNFLDLVGAASRVVWRTPVPAVAVAHNYVFLRADARGIPGPWWTRRAVLAWVRATAAGAEERLALSFGDVEVGGAAAARARTSDGGSGQVDGGSSAGGPPDGAIGEAADAGVSARTAAGRGFRLAPPLLRPGLSRLSPSDGDYLLAYALNAGYGDRLAAWHRRNPGVRVHCYVEGGGSALRTAPAPGFEAHELDQERFLAHLAGCRAYVGSAGFESICEAYWLGKPVLAVPTRGQFEQRLNAWDAARHGAARAGDYDDLDAFWADPPRPDPEAVGAFRAWVARAPEVHVEAVERAAGIR